MNHAELKHRLFLAVLLAWLTLNSNATERSLPAGVRISVILTKSISAKFDVGRPVEAETTSEVKLPNSKITIPKGTRLIGRISIAVPHNKRESRLSIVLERVEINTRAIPMRAFIVGKVRARNSKLGQGPGAIYGVQIGGVPTHVPAIQQIPVDNSCRLVLSDNPEIGSEVVSKERDVAIDIGSTFDVMTVEN